MSNNVISTERKQIRIQKFVEMPSNMLSKVIVDGQNLYQLQKLQMAGWSSYYVGRAAIDRDRANYSGNFRGF